MKSFSTLQGAVSTARACLVVGNPGVGRLGALRAACIPQIAAPHRLDTPFLTYLLCRLYYHTEFFLGLDLFCRCRLSVGPLVSIRLSTVSFVFGSYIVLRSYENTGIYLVKHGAELYDCCTPLSVDSLGYSGHLAGVEGAPANVSAGFQGGASDKVWCAVCCSWLLTFNAVILFYFIFVCGAYHLE